VSDSRYVVGIDLGTTHTVLSYVDTEAGAEPRVEVLQIPQTVTPSQVETRDHLPSFIYLAAGPEFPAGALDLPWAKSRNYTVGELARSQGAAVPARLVASAKSWLCHPDVDRTAPQLPWQAPEDVPRISPLDASARYLEHLRDAWNELMAADDPFASLEGQEVYLTVPASFDAVARDLTLKAAQRAGLSNVTLLEEPQAAFYAWLGHQGDGWRESLGVGDVVLVCDIGGGTSDFSLIAVREEEGDLALERIAVGEHILLGGDNMDLALSFTVAERLRAKGHDLDPWQTRSLWYACRVAKEQILADPELDEAPVTVLGRGTKVVGGTVTTELSRLDIQKVLLAGFFPACEVSEHPAEQRRAGLQELGLPYASDPAVTKHLAKFLSRHLSSDESEQSFVRPTSVLFNGGVMKSEELRGRISEVLGAWIKQSGAEAPGELQSESLDLAVSAGAAYYGLVRRGRGIRIRGGTARSYYIGIESAMPAVPGMPSPLKALCVVPFGMEEGTDSDIPGREFGMVVGEPVEFRFLSSTVRKEDSPGALIERWGEDEIEELIPIQTAMTDEEDAPGTTIPVTLHAAVTEVGTLDLQLRSRDGRSWKLEYYVRS
jgi:Hsp70 protein